MKFFKNFSIIFLCLVIFSMPAMAGWFSAFGVNVGVEVDDEVIGTMTVAGLWPSIDYYKMFPDDPLMGGPFGRLDQSFPKGWVLKFKISCEIDPEKVYGYECYVTTLSGQVLKLDNDFTKNIDINSLDDSQRSVIMSLGGVFTLDSNQIKGTGPVDIAFFCKHHASKNRYYVIVFTIETDKDGLKVNHHNMTMFAGNDGLISFPLGFQFINGPYKGFKTGDFLLGENTWLATQEEIMGWINNQISGEGFPQQQAQQMGKITVISAEKSDYLIFLNGDKYRSDCPNQNGQVFFDHPFERPNSPKPEIGSEITFQKILVSEDGKSFERIGEQVKVKYDGKAVEIRI